MALNPRPDALRRATVIGVMGGLWLGRAHAETREFQLGEARDLSVTLPCELQIGQGAQRSLHVEAEAKVLSALRLNLSGERAVLELARPVQTRQKILVKVNLPRLSRLACASAVEARMGAWSGGSLSVALDGSSRLRFERLQVPELDVRQAGASELSGSGEVARQSYRIEGAGRIDTRGLKGQQVLVQIEGSGDAVVWAERELDVRVSGVGNVSYLGQPRLRQDIQGVGNIQRL